MSIWTDLTPLPHCLEYVDAAGISTRTLRAGNPGAQAVVFLHGTSGHLEAFSRNISAHAEYDLHALDMLAANVGGLRSVISEVVPLDDAPDAFDRIRAGKVLKTVVKP